MTDSNSFANARIKLAGTARGVDEAGHRIYVIERSDGTVLAGEYFEVFNGNDFNLEIGMFGFCHRNGVGNPHPSARLHFSAEDTLAAEKLIRSFFSTPSVAMDKWQYVPNVRFLGGVSFRPNWIIPEPDY
jgi:hypothetical protein